jgi:hypothetical protein
MLLGDDGPRKGSFVKGKYGKELRTECPSPSETKAF